MPTFFIMIPLVGALALGLSTGTMARRTAFIFAVVLCISQILLAVFPPAGFWMNSQGWFAQLLHFRSHVDDLSRVLLLSIPMVVLVALLVGRYVIEDAGRRADFIQLLILCMGGMNAVVLASDLFTVYVFLEVTAVASLILIASDKNRDSLDGAFKYLLLSAVATVMILAAIALFLLIAGGAGFGQIKAACSLPANRTVVLLASALLLGGFFIKSGLVPFHGWLPDAYMAAPAPVSVLLAGIVTKTTGVYALARVVSDVLPPMPEVSSMLLVAGTISIVVGALAAMGQKDFKRMLAFSSISQVGYIILGLGIGTPLALAGALFHFFNHAVGKSLLFVNAAAVERQTGTRDMDRLGGLAERMPVTGATSIIAFLSTAGVPPLAGFWSKFFIILAAWEAGFHGYAVIALLTSLLTLTYFLGMQRKVFFGHLAAGLEGIREANAWATLPAVALAAAAILPGILIPWVFGTFLLPVWSLL